MIKNKTSLIISGIIILLITSFNSQILNGLDIFDSAKNNSKWEKLAKIIQCRISSDKKYAHRDAGKYPVLKIKLKYKGKNKITINWDKNFGRVLWQGKFILMSRSNSKRQTTSEMKYRTSNTYPPRERTTLRRGDTVTSKLDFKQLPSSYAKTLFRNKGRVKFQLGITVKNKFKPISNIIIIRVK